VPTTVNAARATQSSGRTTGVSVVVPHYGDPITSRHVVEQLQIQETDRPYEIIVVDDCSPRPFPQIDGVRTIRRTTNGGFGSAVNTGARLACHPHLLILNSDLEIDPTFLEALAATADRGPAVLGPRVLTLDGHVAPTARRFSRRRHHLVEWLEPLARFRTTAAWHRAVGHDNRIYADTDFYADWVVGCALMLPRRLFLDVGGFDPRYRMNCEEVDLQRRLRDWGVGVRYVASVICRHESGASSGSVIARQRQLCASRLAYVEKWDGRKARYELQIALTLATAVNTLWRIFRRLARRPVQPIEQTRLELSLIWRPSQTPTAES